MDPLSNIFPELHDMVFQHYTVWNFKQFSLLSPNWNAVLGKSLTMMKKVKLVLGRYSHKLPDDAVINSTARRFRNISLRCSEMDFQCPDQIVKYIKISALTLFSLEITDLKNWGEGNRKLLDQVDLSRLKVLSLHAVTRKVTERLLGRCDSLIELDLSLLWDHDISQDSIGFWLALRSFLVRNQNLETLKLTQSFYMSFFKKDISEIANFRLKNLEIINNNYALAIPEDIERNFLKFLEKQSLSLKRIKFTDCEPNVIEHIFLRMPALESLAIREVFRTEQIQRNENIIELNAPDFERLEDFEKIIRAVPKLKILFAFEITRERLEIIKRNLKELRSLRFEYSSIALDDQIWATLWPHATLIRSRVINLKTYYRWSVNI